MDQTLRTLAVVAEVALALLVTSAVAFTFMAPLVPQRVELAFPLVRDLAAGGPRSSPADLVRRVEEAGWAEGVRLTLVDGRDHLTLTGTLDPTALEARVSALLVEQGYLAQSARETTLVDPEDIVTSGDGRLLPVLLSIQTAIFLLGGLLLARWRLSRDALRPALTWWRAGLLGLAGGVAALALSIAVAAGLTAIGLPVEEQEWVRAILERPEVLARVVPWLVILGPLGEEVFFRGYVQRRVGQQAGFPAGLLVSSVLFAVSHLNLSGFLIYLAMGVALGWVYERSGRLLAPVIGHVVVNVTLIVSGLIGA